MGSLREQCKQRLKVAFDEARAVKSSLTFILVVDDYALKVLSNTIKMMELINYGITSVERLELKRKKFHKIEAVYLIHPSSYQLLLDDYSVAGQPQYHAIHVLFLTTIPPKVMTDLSDNPDFVKRVLSLKELNMNFLLHSQNQFLIANQQASFTNALQAKDMELEKLVKTSVDQLTTVLTAFSSFFIVQILYTKSLNSNLTEKIAQGLKTKLQGLFKIYDKAQCNNYTNSSPQTTFLILDRSFDPVSPLVRDFHYGPLMYDLKNVKDHKITQETSKKGAQKKTHNFRQGDQIFDQTKFMHFAKAMEYIPKLFQDFSSNNVAAKFQKNADNKNMDKMADVMKKLPQYNQSKQKYSLHLNLIQEVMDTYKQKNLRKIGELQQSIISMTNQQGKKCKTEDLVDRIVKILEQIAQENDKARIIALALMCLELKPKQKNILIAQCDKLNKFSDIHRKTIYLTGHGLCQLISRKQKLNKQQNLILDKHVPKIEQIIKQYLNGNNGDLKFLRVGSDVKNQKAKMGATGTLGRKKIGLDAQTTSKPRLIVFVTGAIGYNEIRVISQLAENYHLIIGSNNYVTPNEYLSLINGLES